MANTKKMNEQLHYKNPENTPNADHQDQFVPEGDPEIIPFEDPFETPPYTPPVPGEGP